MKKLLFFLTLAAGSLFAAGDAFLKDQDTILLIGDSITEIGFRNRSSGFYHQLTNAVAQVEPERKLQFIPMGYSGFQVKTWVDMERDSLKRDRWTNYRNPGWNLREVFSNKVDVAVIFLGMNDILQPSVRFREETHIKWQEDLRTLMRNIRERSKPRLFVLCTITPLTADPDSPKNIVRGRLNARLRDVAMSEGNTLVADYGAVIEELSDAARRIRPDYQVVPDFVHPNNMGHTAMAFCLMNTLGEKKLSEYFSAKVREEFMSLADSVKTPSLSYRFRQLRTTAADADEVQYELRWNWRDTPDERQVARVPRVTVQAPEGWEVRSRDLCAKEATVYLRGKPDRLVNPVIVTAVCGSNRVEQVIQIPTPWRVSAPFDFPKAWNGQNWQKDVEAPVKPEQARGWNLATANWDYTGFMDPGSIDPYQTMFGFQLDSFYATRWVYSPKARKVALKFSHRTFSATLGLTAWIDGVQVFADSMNRSGKNRVEGEAALKVGWNQLLIRCDHANWQRQFSCSLAPLAGDDLSDLRWSWKQPAK